MSIEQQVVPGLIAETGVTVRSLHGEQLDDLQPARVPLIVVQRIGTAWDAWNNFCRPNVDIADVLLQIDTYAETLEQARRLMDTVRRWMADNIPCSLDNEMDMWESERVYRTTATYSVTDVNPAII
jgi:hypothetical protein